MSEDIIASPINIPQSELDDLNHRLVSARWPERETVVDSSQGVPLADIQALCAYWRDDYDWRRCEALLNSLGPSRTVIDGLGIHFLHVRSPHGNALPLLMTHGWPGSVLEFRKVIAPLTDPTIDGGKVEDAFHLILPSMPGYGFSDKPLESNWGVERTARAWVLLMQRLGYDHFVVQGGDWGADIAAQMAHMRPSGCLGIHLNTLFFGPEHAEGPERTPAERRTLEKMAQFDAHEAGYFKQQATRPQTLGYGLADSPIGQAAWIYEKLCAWSDTFGKSHDIFTFDEILDNIMLYWLPNTGASSARLYWNSIDNTAMSIDIPVGVTVFSKDINVAPKAWAERYYRNLIHWNDVDVGGHFGAWEQPKIFVSEIRNCFRHVRP